MEKGSHMANKEKMCSHPRSLVYYLICGYFFLQRPHGGIGKVMRNAPCKAVQCHLSVLASPH